MQPSILDAEEPSVGIFWSLAEGNGPPRWLTDFRPLAAAEPYGEFLTHGGHYTFWESLARLGAAELRRRQLPTAPSWSEYEEWPRGRVVYHRPSSRFVLYADRKLQKPALIEQIRRRFAVPEDAYDLRSDPHYVSTR